MLFYYLAKHAAPEHEQSFSKIWPSGGQHTCELLAEKEFDNSLLRYKASQFKIRRVQSGYAQKIGLSWIWDLCNHSCYFLTFPKAVTHANYGNVIMTYRALAGIAALCMTAFGDANIGMTCFNLLFYSKAASRTFLHWRPIHVSNLPDILITDRWAENDKQGHIFPSTYDCINVHWNLPSFCASAALSFVSRFDNCNITDSSGYVLRP